MRTRREVHPAPVERLDTKRLWYQIQKAATHHGGFFDLPDLKHDLADVGALFHAGVGGGGLGEGETLVHHRA